MLQLTDLTKIYSQLKQLLARSFRKIYSMVEFIAVIDQASPGLATLAINQILSEKYPVVLTSPSQPSSLVNTILRLSPKVHTAILDLSDDDSLQLDSSLMLVDPTTLVITRILETPKIEVLADCLKKLPEDRTLILNWDDPNCRRLANSFAGEIVYFGKDSSYCHVWADNIKLVNFQTRFELNYGVERVEINTPLLGQLQIEPLLAAATWGIRADLSLVNIKKSLAEMEISDGGLRPYKGFADSVILDGSTSEHPLVVEAAIDVLNKLPARRRIMVIGEIGPTNQLSTTVYQQLARRIYRDRIDLVFTTGGDATLIGEELTRLGFIPERLQINLPIQQIVTKLLKILAKGDVVLLCGAKAVRLDEVVKKITRK